MKLFIVAILWACAEAALISTNNINCVVIRNVNYEKEVLKNYLQSPYQLAIDHHTNTLFFSYTARGNEMFKIAYFDLKTNEFGEVSGIHGGFANTVNNKDHIVYMGGNDGIYKFNNVAKSAINLHITESVNVWQMFYKDGIYFTTYPEEKAYLYKDKHVTEVPEVKGIKVMLIAVTNDNNIVYSNSSGLFMFNKDKGSHILLSTAVINGLTADNDGQLYYSTPNGLYFINDKTESIQELAKIDNTFGIAIESNGNIIYASEDSIIRLKPSNKKCFPQRLIANDNMQYIPELI